jgi:hypothetical protein
MSPLTRISLARPASQFVPPLLRGALLLAIVAACGGSGGGGGDTVTGPKLVSTGPGSTGVPDVAGVYTRIDNAAPSTCTPQDLPAGGGTVRLQAFVDCTDIRLYQNGTRIQLAYLSFPDEEADTGTVDFSGNVAMGIAGTAQKENPCARERGSSTST